MNFTNLLRKVREANRIDVSDIPRNNIAIVHDMTIARVDCLCIKLARSVNDYQIMSATVILSRGRLETSTINLNLIVSTYIISCEFIYYNYNM